MIPITPSAIRSYPPPFRTEALLSVSQKSSVLSLTVHMVFRNILSLYLAGSLVGCCAGLLVKKGTSRYHFADRAYRILLQNERYLPLIKIASLALALFLNIWSKAPAIILSIGLGMWTGCTLEMKQTCQRYHNINPFANETV